MNRRHPAYEYDFRTGTEQRFPGENSSKALHAGVQKIAEPFRRLPVFSAFARGCRRGRSMNPVRAQESKPSLRVVLALPDSRAAIVKPCLRRHSRHLANPPRNGIGARLRFRGRSGLECGGMRFMASRPRPVCSRSALAVRFPPLRPVNACRHPGNQPGTTREGPAGWSRAESVRRACWRPSEPSICPRRPFQAKLPANVERPHRNAETLLADGRRLPALKMTASNVSRSLERRGMSSDPSGAITPGRSSVGQPPASGQSPVMSAARRSLRNRAPGHRFVSVGVDDLGATVRAGEDLEPGVEVHHRRRQLGQDRDVALDFRRAVLDL